MIDKRWTATYEIEVSLPLHDADGNLQDIDLAPKLVMEAGGTLDGTGAGLGFRDADGSANFKSPEEALKWKEDTLQSLLTQFPKADFPDRRPRVHVGLRIFDNEDSDGFYTELIKKDGQFFAEGEDNCCEPIRIPFDEIQIVNAEYHELLLQDDGLDIERRTIQAHHRGLGALK